MTERRPREAELHLRELIHPYAGLPCALNKMNPEKVQMNE